MARRLALGNGGSLLILDDFGRLRDWYYPHVSLENHIGGDLVHRIGVMVDNTFHWLDGYNWRVDVLSEPKTLASNILAYDQELGIKLQFNDVVYNEDNVFVRRITVENMCDHKRSIKLFFSQEFELYGSQRGDTAYYDPISKAMIHYKGRRVFLINLVSGNKQFDDYTVGAFASKGREGAFRDAEDGVLSKNGIEHGRVDSVIGITLEVEARSQQVAYYWIVVNTSIPKVQEMNRLVLKRSPQHILKTTRNYWRAWIDKQPLDFADLDERVIELYHRSLFNIRTHIDHDGGIIASGDSEILQQAHDTYGYVWPRDGAFTAIALIRAGYANLTKAYFEFCNRIITDDGYLMQKYKPDGSLGSSWHPWVLNGKLSLPIQEDETALTIYALWKYFETTKDLEFIEELYNSLIKKAADFMVRYRDMTTGLPQPSYDLWEMKNGIFTFTSGAVVAGLEAAGKFARILGKIEQQREYELVAQKIRNSIIEYLFDKSQGIFYQCINIEGCKIVPDATLDISALYGVFAFDILPPDDMMVKQMLQAIEERLLCKTAVGGVCRFEHDVYYQVSRDTPGNPWFITSLWLAQYYAKRATQPEELVPVRNWINWATRYALPSGAMSEQINPYTGEQISATPLTWSHAEFIITVLDYLDKRKLNSKEVHT